MYCGVGRRLGLGGGPVLRGGPFHPIAIIYDVTIYIYTHSYLIVHGRTLHSCSAQEECSHILTKDRRLGHGLAAAVSLCPYDKDRG